MRFILIMRGVAVAAIVAAAGMTAGPAAAQSFNCARASTPDEKAVCDSPRLSSMDSEMGALYDGIMKCALMGTRGDARESQRTFLADRADCGANEQCITRLYDRQIRSLRKISDGMGQGAC